MAKQKGFSIVEGLVIVLILGIVGFAGWYVIGRSSDEPVAEQQNTEAEVNAEPTVTDSSNVDDEEVASDMYQSVLYPNLSFSVPSGWTVDEPADYSGSAFFTADSVILLTNGSATLNLRLDTIPPTGFEGYTCSLHEDLEKVRADVHRFTSSDGLLMYRAGVSDADEGWAAASTGDFSYSEDENPNYCVIVPFIGEYTSTLNKADYPESAFNGVSSDSELILGWLSADLEGDTSQESLDAADSVIKSLSTPESLL